MSSAATNGSASALEDPVEPLREAERVGGISAWLNAVDLAIYREVRSLARVEGHVSAVRAFSTLGEYGALWFGIGAAGVLFHKPRRAHWRRALISVAAAHGASSAIKLVVNRQRPAVEDLEHLMHTPTGLSFPSTHTTCAFAAARAYSKFLPTGPMYALATTMAFTRLYLGVHYPSDVAAGAFLGTVMGSAGR